MNQFLDKNLKNESNHFWIIEAMQSFDVKRLVTLVGAGVETESDPTSMKRAVTLKIMKMLMSDMIEDAQLHTDIIRQSNLDWRIVRPPSLTDGDRTGVVEAGYLKLGFGSMISRADVAEFMLNQLSSKKWIREAPMVTSG
jgi:putative NADH-flavin reductase